MSREEIMTIIVALIGSGIINATISHILYSRKLKKELKNNGNNMVAKEIEKSLLAIRDLELKTKEIEYYKIVNGNDKISSDVNVFEHEPIYPSIYNSIDSVKKFYECIQTCREDYEKNVPIKIALNLVFIDRYITQSILFIKSNMKILSMPEWGGILIFDIQKWQKRFDRMLIKEINKHNYKLRSHATRKWNRTRKKEVEKQYDETILKFLITGETSKKNIKKLKKIQEFISNKPKE